MEINQVSTAEQADALITFPTDASTDTPISEDINPVLAANASQSSVNIENVPVCNPERGIVFYDLMTVRTVHFIFSHDYRKLFSFLSLYLAYTFTHQSSECFLCHKSVTCASTKSH